MGALGPRHPAHIAMPFGAQKRLQMALGIRQTLARRFAIKRCRAQRRKPKRTRPPPQLRFQLPHGRVGSCCRHAPTIACAAPKRH